MSDAIEAALLPCPFCGWTDMDNGGLCHALRSEDNPSEVIGPSGVCCPNCSAYAVGGMDDDEAIAAWNRRPALTAYEAAKGGGVGVKPVGFARSVDVDPVLRPFEGKTSFWCSENQNAYYSVPVFLTSPASGERDAVTQAAADVLAERKRQVEAKGWTAEHDDRHDSGELASAAVAYALRSASDLGLCTCEPTDFWPWEVIWWKPSEDPRRNYIKAAALLVAEIERLDRHASLMAELADALRMEGK